MCQSVKVSLVLLLVASILACSNRDPVKEAEEKVAFLKKTGSLEDICAASKDVERAYLEKKDELGYLSAQINTQSACSDADVFRRDGYDPRHPDIKADDLTVSFEADNK